ncbi:hydrolase, alpha/beta domain protein [Ancylostoma ceylanicum]|uniref:Hydrolase, alpha/beta domain protein n=1 Tax=Ancylostoma ceylanicum TaxID=53326 RepID=A0A0D6LLB6_9BILA|nr:hydrolase, alpha/beta domain protein [Ancylostoma ceylanicum]
MFTPMKLVLLITSTLAIDPECYMTVPEITRHFGYPSEVHLVRTQDDYILELHRIPHGRNQLERDFCTRKRSDLHEYSAFVFADAGFDVWIANSRGTPPSQKHIGYGPDDVRFWNFTWQDISAYDLSSSIDYVLQKTGHNDLYYIGHSQGTMVMFAKLAEDPSFGRKFVLHRIPNSPLALPKILQKIMGFFCSLPLAQGVCTLDIGFIDGSEKMFNNVVKSRKVEKFDYGEEGNMKEYGMKTPPIYDLRNIKTPTFLYWSKDDILADTEDIRETILASMNETIRGNYELPHYTHLDFVFGINATTDLYRPIIEEIRRDANTRMMLLDNRVHT